MNDIEKITGISKVKALCYTYLKPAVNLKKEIASAISEFVDNRMQNDTAYINRIKRDILFCCYYYQIIPAEYFYYHFEEKNDRGRSQYVGHLLRGKMWDKFNTNGAFKVLDNKKNTYEIFKEYFGREMILLREEKDYENFCGFISRHPTFISKPVSAKKGHGIEVLHIDPHDNLQKRVCFSKIIGGGETVVEELIEQDFSIARFHPQSVNTVRFITFLDKGCVNKILAVLRMGRGGSVIDNASAGGIFALIDIETGIIISKAQSHRKEEFLTHPDSGCQILGARIPQWDKLLELVEKLPLLIPNQKQVGWDFALSDKGWVIVEANSRPGMQRLCQNYGLKERCQCMFDAYFMNG